MGKQNTGLHFEDFYLDQRLRHATPRTLTEGDVALYIALTGSRFPLQSADTAAQAVGLPRRPVDDLLAFHIAFGKTVPDVSLNAIANLGYADVRFLQPVYTGDTLSAESEVIGLKENANGKSGVVYVRSVASNQSGKAVFSWNRWVMVRKQNPEAPAPETYVPDLPVEVPVSELSIPEGLNGSGFDVALTGSPHLWDDYDLGERIDHRDGMTIDDSDHTLATKLYQNTARVHFDERMMSSTPHGRRLMYGGHVISICRALSFNGLANAITVAAINGGTHSNPSFGGDTLYAYSEILAKEALSRDDLGALRIRTVGVKNLDSQEVESPTYEENGRLRYHPNVVLDLDYTILMPRHRSEC